MSCNCRSCGPQCDSVNPGNCLDGIDIGKLIVSDENCDQRILEGSLGIIYADEDGNHFVTDGSQKRGPINLKPPYTDGADTILVLDENGNVYQLGEALVEGNVLIVRGGKLVLASQTEEKTTFDPEELRKGSGPFAVFICGPNGTVTLGQYDGCKDGIMAFDEDGLSLCLSYTALAEALLIPICSVIKVVQPDDIFKGSVVCTDQGLRLQTSSPKRLWSNPPLLIYKQIKLYPGFVLPPGNTVTDIPSAGPGTTGYFASETLAVNLATQTGYDVRATAVVLNCLLKGYGGGGSFDMVLVVNGMEYCRVPLVDNATSGSDNSQIIVPIPDNKIIEIKALRQVNSGIGSGDESTSCLVWLQAWEF